MHNKAKQAAKKNYYNSIIDKNKLDMKRTWSILKEVIGKKNYKSAFPQTFCINNKSVADTSEVAEDV